MLYDADTIQTVIRTLKTHYTTTQLPPIICDPVSVSTSGHELLQKDAIKILLDELFPAAALITPNKAEAEALLVALGEPMEINNVEDMLKAAQRLLERSGSASVLLKGGHVTARQPDVQHLLKMTRDLKIIRDGGLPGPNMEVLSPAEGNMDNLELVVDVLCEKDRKTLFLRPRIDSTSTHGTGCTLSAAIACALASGSSSESYLFLSLWLRCNGVQQWPRQSKPQPTTHTIALPTLSHLEKASALLITSTLSYLVSFLSTSCFFLFTQKK